MANLVNASDFKRKMCESYLNGAMRNIVRLDVTRMRRLRLAHATPTSVTQVGSTSRLADDYSRQHVMFGRLCIVELTCWYVVYLGVSSMELRWW